MKNFKKYIYPLSALLVIIVLLLVTFATLSINNTSQTETSVSQDNKIQEITYQGKNGVDAYTLLTENADIEENTSGLIIELNGRKADESQNEFWAFYVNDKQAQVGPKEYITKDTDTIKWKIEKY